MSYVVFRNKGVIDPRSITTFGASSKENKGAIGFFGTGLKYAVAILLREGCEISILSGNKRLDFGSRKTKIRVDSFDLVTMNKRAIGFTTELGKTWEVWQAMRELYCNMLDERGEAVEVENFPEPDPESTQIIVRGEKFTDAWASRSDIILSTDAIEKNESVHIHPGQSQYVFYRGIRAYKLNTPSSFTYNIQRKCELTEDRTLKYSWDADAAIRKGFCESKTPALIQRAVTAPKQTYENTMTFEGCLPSKEFIGIVRDLANKRDIHLNRSALEAVRVWASDELHAGPALQLDPVESAMLQKAINFNIAMGYAVSDYPIVVTEFLGEGVLGRAENGTIFVSRRTFMMGTKMLAGTLAEEYFHLKFNTYDETRSFQNFLVDAIMTLGEKLLGEPL